jgi:hypothetical protein
MADFTPQALALETGRGHEPDQVKVKGLLGFAVALVGVILVVLAIAVLIARWFSGKEREQRSLLPPRFSDLSPAFPAPRLQAAPAADLVKLKREAEHHLESYGWIDRKAGIAHIPIERALDIVAKSGIPRSEMPLPIAPAPSPRPKVSQPQAGSFSKPEPGSTREDKP